MPCSLNADRRKAHFIAGLELAELPQVGLDDGHWADEAAQARAVWAEDHRHVAGEVHRANRIGVVVDVGGVQAGFAAAVAYPLRFGADQAHAGSAGVEVHFPSSAEKGVDVAFGEIFRRAMGSVDHADFAHGRQCRAEFSRQLCVGLAIGQRQQVQHVTGTQGAAAVAAELAEGEGAFRTQVFRHLQAAAQGEIRTCAAASDGAETECAADFDQQRAVHSLLDAVHA